MKNMLELNIISCLKFSFAMLSEGRKEVREEEESKEEREEGMERGRREIFYIVYPIALIKIWTK
jgi:hypothetical protein